MTIGIGIVAKNGAVLVSDCYGTRIDGSNFYKYKIHNSIYDPQDKGKVGRKTGIYSASAGYYYMMDTGELCHFSMKANMADLITSPEVLSLTVEQIYENIDAIEKKTRVFPRPKDYEKLIEELKELEARREARSFIESTQESGLFNVSRLTLRISDNFSPDIVLIRNDKVTKVDSFETIGSGSSLVRPFLEKNRSDKIDNCLEIACNALNIALEQRNKFQGYQIVVVERNGETDIIREARSNDASRVNLDELVVRD